jgi:hypothetical protein
MIPIQSNFPSPRGVHLHYFSSLAELQLQLQLPPVAVCSTTTSISNRASLPFLRVPIPISIRRPKLVRCSSINGSEKAQQRNVSAYPFQEIEPRWQRHWHDNNTFRTPEEVDVSKPKCYILDMFPYPRFCSHQSFHFVPLQYFSFTFLNTILDFGNELIHG